MKQPIRAIYLTDEEIDRLLEKLDILRNDPDARYLQERIYLQQIYNPSDKNYYLHIRINKDGIKQIFKSSRKLSENQLQKIPDTYWQNT